MVNGLVLVTDCILEASKHLILGYEIRNDLRFCNEFNRLLLLTHSLVNACLKKGELSPILLLELLLFLIFHCLFERCKNFEGAIIVLCKIKGDGIGDPIGLNTGLTN